MPKRFGYPKAERLKSRKQIDVLFAKGKAVSAPPVRAIYLFAPAETGSLLVGVTASKKHFKKAVDRNRAKRLLREAYRLQKETLAEPVKATAKSGAIFFVYADKSIANFETIKAAVGKCLEKLSKIVQREDPA
jgi:ribonuclease P protein component